MNGLTILALAAFLVLLVWAGRSPRPVRARRPREARPWAAADRGEALRIVVEGLVLVGILGALGGALLLLAR